MPWEIKLLKDEGIISSECYGTLDYKQILQMFSESIDTGNKYMISKYLTDHRKSKHDLSPVDIYNLPMKLKNKGLKYDDKVALLVSPESIKKEKLNFIETVSHIVGLNLKIFTDKEKAFDWIK